MDRPNEGRGGDGCGGWRDFIPAAALLVFGLAGLGMAMLAPSGNGGQYAVVAPPWYDLRQTMALVQAADGLVSGTGGLANIVVAHSDSPGFISALYRAGAWAVIDPIRERGCIGDRRTAQGDGG